MTREQAHCSQCGKPFEEPACGPTHATIAAERLHLKPIPVRILNRRVSSGCTHWTVDCEMSDGSVHQMDAREAKLQILEDLEAESLHLERVEGDPEACDIARAVFPVRVHSSDGSTDGFRWYDDWEMSDGTIRTLNAREARMMQQSRISALLDHVYPDTDLDRELEEAELLSRCYTLPYSIEEIGAAFIAVRKHPTNKVLAMRDTIGFLKRASLPSMGLHEARDLVYAVAEKIGAYPGRPYVCEECGVGNGHAEWCSRRTQGTGRHAGVVLKNVIPLCDTCGTPATHIARDVYTLYDPTSTTDRFQPGEMKAGCDAHPVESRTIDTAVNERPLFASFSVPAIQETRRSPLDALTQRAINDFLGTGMHRTQGLRGMLSFLTQEDLMTVLAESVVLIDDEHLQQSVRMLGPDDLQSLNFATAGEVSTRMLDEEVPQDFPLRPLEPHESREPVDWSEHGNPLLAKDVALALDQISLATAAVPYSDEAALAESLERDTGWNSVYAGAAAQEAWKRYYWEPDSEPGDWDTGSEGEPT